MRVRSLLLLQAALILPVLLAGCGSTPVTAEPPPSTPSHAVQPLRPDVAPAQAVSAGFTLEADKLDTWNAVGQILVRTPGVHYQGRSQMLDLYSLRYRGVEFLILTKALLASETHNRLTTRVTATTGSGKSLDDGGPARDAAVELLLLLQRELPAEIQSVRKRQAAGKKASAP